MSAPGRALVGAAAGAGIGALAGITLDLGFAGVVLLGCHGTGCEPAGFAILATPGGALTGGILGAPVGAVVGLCVGS